MVIKLKMRKMSAGSTMNADAQSVCKPLANLLVWTGINLCGSGVLSIPHEQKKDISSGLT